MSSRRYYIATLPVSHLNGKLAPCRIKCRNTYTPEEEVQGFMYGYKRAAQPDVNRFGIRNKCRNLNINPYTAAEDENRTLFTASLHNVFEHKKIEADWGLCLADFNKQGAYITPIGFAVSMCRLNGGYWPPAWTA